MSPTLVTGASGLLGGALVAALLDRDEEVVALTRDPAAADVDARCRPVIADVTDRHAIERAIAEHAVTTVFHLAAQATVQGAIDDPATTYTTNIMGTTAVMEAAARGGVRRVVVASSASAYGPSAAAPHVEDMELAPTNAYDISKAASDLSARAYHATCGLPVATARLSNVYGAGDRNRSRLIPELIAAALDGRAPRIRSDGTPRRGFLHLDDAVDAYLAIADALDDPAAGARGQAFNAGWPEPIAVRDVVATLEDVLGRPLHARYEVPDRSAATPSCQYVANAKLTAATGWTPKIDLHEGLSRTVAWYAAARAAAAAA